MRTLLAVAALALFALPAAAADRGNDGMFKTGDGIRYKKIAFINIKVYAIDHEMKDLPTQKSKQAVIDANVDKKFHWKMLRTVEAEKIKNALREAYAKNGYSDAAKINPFVDSIAKELKEGDSVTIRYDAAAKATTISSPGRLGDDRRRGLHEGDLEHLVRQDRPERARRPAAQGLLTAPPATASNLLSALRARRRIQLIRSLATRG